MGFSERLARSRRATRYLRASTATAPLAAAEMPVVFEQRARPSALFARFGVRQRRPIGCRGFWPGAGVPRADANVEIAGAVRPVGLRREFVDGCRVDGVLALLRALDVPVFPASRTEKIAPQPLPVRAATASAFCGKCTSPPATTGRPSVETRLAARGKIPVGLDSAWPPATALAAGRGRLAEGFGMRDIRCKGAAQLGEHQVEVHGGLLFGFEWPTRAASVPERPACARRPVTSRQRGRSAAQNPPG